MRRRRQRNGRVNHERWLVSYADFITLLFAFFVVLYASSQVDKRKVGRLALAIQVAFQEMGVFQASTTEVPIDVAQPMPFAHAQAIENTERTASLGGLISRPEGGLGRAWTTWICRTCNLNWKLPSRRKLSEGKLQCDASPMAWSSVCARLVSLTVERRT